MNTKLRLNIFMLLLLSTIITFVSSNTTAAVLAGWGGHHYHGHGGYGPRPHYQPGIGGFFYDGPNIIINVPTESYIPPPVVCRNVEVCNTFNECWIERHCV